VASGLVAGDDRGVCGEAEPLLGGLDLAQERLAVPGRDGPEPGLLSPADGKGELPGVPAQLQSEVEHRGGRDGRILTVSRCHGKAPEKRIWDPNWSLTAAAHILNSPYAPLIASDTFAAPLCRPLSTRPKPLPIVRRRPPRSLSPNVEATRDRRGMHAGSL